MKLFQSDFKITLNSKDLTSAIEPRLVSLTITESRAEEADTLDIVLDDTDGRMAIPSRNAVLAVSIGWAGESLVYKGKYIVDEVEHSGAPDIITLRARSASLTKGMGERIEKSWHGQTIGAIVKAIAGKHNLKATLGDALAKVTIPHIDQTHESDMAFLTRLAKRYDAVMTVKDEKLIFMPIGQGVTASGKKLTVLNIKRESGDQHRYHVAERESYTSVRAFYHSSAKGAKGKRKSVVIGGEDLKNVKVLPEVYATEAEALSVAKAEFSRTQRGQATMNFTLALGRPEIFPEMPVNVSGFKEDIDDTPWLVRRATHTLSDSGLLTSLELEMRDDPVGAKHRTHFRKPG